MAYGIISILRYLKTGDSSLLWTGLFLGGAHLIIFSLNLVRSTQNEILFNDIKSIKTKQRFNRNFLDIKLKNYRLRRVVEIENLQELEIFIKVNICTKINTKSPLRK